MGEYNCSVNQLRSWNHDAREKERMMFINIDSVIINPKKEKEYTAISVATGYRTTGTVL